MPPAASLSRFHPPCLNSGLFTLFVSLVHIVLLGRVGDRKIINLRRPYLLKQEFMLITCPRWPIGGHACHHNVFVQFIKFIFRTGQRNFNWLQVSNWHYLFTSYSLCPHPPFLSLSVYSSLSLSSSISLCHPSSLSLVPCRTLLKRSPGGVTSTVTPSCQSIGREEREEQGRKGGEMR